MNSSCLKTYLTGHKLRLFNENDERNNDIHAHGFIMFHLFMYGFISLQLVSSSWRLHLNIFQKLEGGQIICLWITEWGLKIVSHSVRSKMGNIMSD